MANRNPYTYTPSYSGKSGYAAAGSRGGVPPRSGARGQPPPRTGSRARPQATPRTRQTPPQARPAQPHRRSRPQARPLKDLVMFAVILFVIPLLGIIGLIYRPMLWVFIAVAGVYLAALWVLNCFAKGSRVLISGVLLALTAVSIIALIDLTPKENYFQTIGGGDPSLVASASGSDGNGSSAASNSGYDVFPGLTTTGDAVPQGDATVTDMVPDEVIQPTAEPTVAPRSAAYFSGSAQKTEPETQPQQAAEIPADTTQLSVTGTDVTGGAAGSVGSGGADPGTNTPAYASLPGMEAASAPLNQAVSGAQAALEGYLRGWSAGDYAEMLKYSLPSWINSQKSPQQQLFWNHNWWILEGWTLSSDVMSPTADAVTVRVIADLSKRSSNRTSARQQYSAIVYNKDSSWYVDPDSMRTGLPVEEATAAPDGAAATAAPNPTIDPGTQLWYNKDGGKYYHAVEKCPEINEKYYSSMASFKYSQLGEEPFNALLPHAACNAPEKPK